MKTLLSVLRSPVTNDPNFHESLLAWTAFREAFWDKQCLFQNFASWIISRYVSAPRILSYDHDCWKYCYTCTCQWYTCFFPLWRNGSSFFSSLTALSSMSFIICAAYPFPHSHSYDNILCAVCSAKYQLHSKSQQFGGTVLLNLLYTVERLQFAIYNTMKYGIKAGRVSSQLFSINYIIT